MLAKIGFVIAGTALAMFAMGRVESLAAHHGFSGSQAWAQQWDDSSGDSSSADDSESKSSPPNVAGTYSGTIEDHRFGAGTISATISQNGSKLSGPWSSSFGSGTLKGKVSSKGTISARLKLKGGCGLNMHGTFENGDEIAGVYTVTGCGKADHGTFDMTD
jgi:hypothetical protein